MNPKSRLALAAVAAAAGILGSRLLYTHQIVPRLGQWHAIPTIWYLLLVPAVIGLVAAAALVRTGAELCSVAALSGAIGFLPMVAEDGAVRAWLAGIIPMALACFLCLAVVFFPLRLLRRGRRRVTE